LVFQKPRTNLESPKGSQVNNTLFGTGIGCIIAAIVGGGLRAFGLEIPVLNSVRRQILLGLFGVILVAVSLTHPGSEKLSENERKVVMEVHHRASEALKGLQVDKADITSAKQAPYMPAWIYYNVVRYLNNSFPEEKNPPDYSVFPEFRGLDFESLIRKLIIIRGEKPLQAAWDGFEQLKKLSEQQNEKLDKQKCLEAVDNARRIVTTKILSGYFKSSIE
jgi:hypothetical protein